MEKIQQALERARKERQDEDKNKKNKTDQSHVADVQSIVYTRTRTVSGDAFLHRENRLLNAMEHNTYADSFKILSTQVMQRMEENHWGSLAITSVGESEGKTTTAINLGISISKEVEYTVLLVDTNLRKPKLHEYFGIKPGLGLSDYLQDGIDLADLFIKPENLNHFVILPGGTPILNSSEMLGSPKMYSLVEELKERYPKRIIIFDVPPVLKTAETLSFVPTIDCVLVVVEDDETKESELRNTIDLLSVTNIIGTVLNKAKY